MQVCGIKCAVCSAVIAVQDQGTWCGRCNTVIHQQCRPSSLCPGCNESFLDPAELFVRSKYCPQCMTSNSAGRDTCVVCGGSTRWDTEDEYQARKNVVQKWGQHFVITGFVELSVALVAGLIVGGLVFVFIIGNYSTRFFGRAIVTITLCALGIATDGVFRIRKGRAFQRFE